MKNKGTPKVRFAPSPTGYLHVGSARSAIFNFLFAKKNNAEIILRLDDTDRQRYKEEYEEDIREGLDWLDIKFDTFYKQSERKNIYRKRIQQLLDSNYAYISKEENIKDGQKDEVIRFKNPGQEVIFKDLIRGEIKVNTEDLGDFVIAKSLDEPLYHLASVVDDIDMDITHIIRGEDHIANTPRHILLTKALGGQEPLYAHIPLILAPDRSKLSKRHGAVSLNTYRQQGYLPEAFFNFLATLGWSPQSKHSQGGTNQEILSRQELLDKFSLEGVQKGGAVFNIEKLKWLNKEYLKKIADERKNSEILRIFEEYNYRQKEKILKLVPIIIERISVWQDLEEMIKDGEFDYFFERPLIDKKMLGETECLPDLIKLITDLDEKDFLADKIKNQVWDFASEKGRQEVLWPFRFILSGKKKSPDPFTIAEILGKDETLERLREFTIGE